jgi:hypothetical protein
VTGNDKTCSRFVVNCAGERVAVDQETYTDRCTIGNTDNFLNAFKDYVNDKLVSFGPPAALNIVIPSHESGAGILTPLRSLLAQNYDQSVEILVFVNEPLNVESTERAANDRTIRLLKNLVAGREDEAVAENPHHENLVKPALRHFQQKKDQVKLVFIREAITGGLAAVYQIAIASYVARLRKFCDDAGGTDRSQRLACTQRHLFRTLILFCDDDVEFADTNAVQNAFNYAVDNNAIILGRIHIHHVELAPEMADSGPLLRDLMQVFLDFKHDGGLSFLAPRGMLLGNALVGGRLEIGQPFAEQLYFANLASERAQFFVKATTSISESNYPGNGLFLRDLANYLSGDDNDALEIFNNVLLRYQETNHWARFCAEDVQHLMNLLQARNTKELSLVTQELLSRV